MNFSASLPAGQNVEFRPLGVGLDEVYVCDALLFDHLVERPYVHNSLGNGDTVVSVQHTPEIFHTGLVEPGTVGKLRFIEGGCPRGGAQRGRYVRDLGRGGVREALAFRFVRLKAINTDLVAEYIPLDVDASASPDVEERQGAFGESSHVLDEELRHDRIRIDGNASHYFHASTAHRCN